MATTLKIGSKGDSVKSLQKSLGITADGIYGKQTAKAVKDYQSANKLTADGIAGSQTQGSLSTKKSSGSSSNSSKLGTNSSKPTVAIKTGTTQGTSYSKTPSGSNFSKFLSKSPTLATNTKQGSSPFNMFGDWVKRTKDSILASTKKQPASAYNPENPIYGGGYQIVPRDPSEGVVKEEAPTPFQILKSGATNFASKVGDIASDVGTAVVDTLSSETTYNASDYKNDTNSQNVDLSLGLPETPLSGDNVGTKTVETTSTDASGNPVVTTEESPLALNSMNTSIGSSNPTMNNSNLNSILTGVDSRMGSINNDPFLSDKSKSQKTLTLRDTTIADLASQTTDPNIWNTPMYQEKLNLINKKNGLNITSADIAGKVQTATNGLTPPKTTAEFLAYQNKATEEERKLLNEQIAIDNNWTQSQKDILLGKKDSQGNDVLLGVAEQQKKENDTLSAFLDKQLANQEESLKKKAQYAIDKAEAEFNSKDAETEINRVKAKNSLTEFLAKIGALRTDGNALTGLETLEQAYQSQRQSLKQEFNMAKREITMNMNDNIYNLESARDEKVFKLNQDLSKTEREVTSKVMELDYNLQKDMLSTKIKWTDAIRVAREKAEAKAEKASEDWTSQFFTISGASAFKDTSKEFQAEWQNNNRWGKTPDGYKTPAKQVGQQFLDYQKTNSSTLKMTDTQVYKLQQEGVDVDKYKVDSGYRDYVNSQLE